MSNDNPLSKVPLGQLWDFVQAHRHYQEHTGTEAAQGVALARFHDQAFSLANTLSEIERTSRNPLVPVEAKPPSPREQEEANDGGASDRGRTKSDECMSCGFQTKIKCYQVDATSIKRFPGGMWLCHVCANTRAGMLLEYPSLPQDMETFKMIAKCTNMVLAEIQKARDVQP